jgi:predicted small secreted protein
VVNNQTAGKTAKDFFMTKNRMFSRIFRFPAVPAIVLVLGLVLAGCDPGNGPGGGGGDISTVIIKNRSTAPIEVELEDDGASGYEYVLSGLEKKTIDANAQATWSLKIMSGRYEAYVGILVSNLSGALQYQWEAYGARPGVTHELTWNGSTLTQPTQ